MNVAVVTIHNSDAPAPTTTIFVDEAAAVRYLERDLGLERGTYGWNGRDDFGAEVNASVCIQRVRS